LLSEIDIFLKYIVYFLNFLFIHFHFLIFKFGSKSLLNKIFMLLKFKFILKRRLFIKICFLLIQLKSCRSKLLLQILNFMQLLVKLFFYYCWALVPCCKSCCYIFFCGPWSFRTFFFLDLSFLLFQSWTVFFRP